MKYGWEAQKQKLIVMMVLDDDIAEALSFKAGDAFFRAFIVEDRKTGELACNFRFRYKDGDSWYAISPKRKGSRAETVAHLEDGMRKVILAAVENKVGLKPKIEVMQSIYVPDDEGEPKKTVDWLLEKGLMKITKIEEEANDRFNG